jgi:SAM-dependent methyltransferase
VLFNQADYMIYGMHFWLNVFGSQLASCRSDIFELGCGCGRGAYALRKCRGFTGTYTGIDVDAEMVDWCSEHYGNSRFVFRHADVFSSIYNVGGDLGYYRFPVGDESQDFVFSQSVFSHLLEERVENYLRETFRVLRPEGCAVMFFFCLEDLKVRQALGGRWTFGNAVGNAYVEKVRCPEAAVAYGREFIVEMCRRIGFGEACVGETELLQSPLLCFKKEAGTTLVGCF